jgi:hypothetical protein
MSTVGRANPADARCFGARPAQVWTRALPLREQVPALAERVLDGLETPESHRQLKELATEKLDELAAKTHDSLHGLRGRRAWLRPLGVDKLADFMIFWPKSCCGLS